MDSSHRIARHIAAGILISPLSKQPLRLSADGAWLETAAATERYRMLDSHVPVLLADEAWAAQYANESPQMQDEYRPSRLKASWLRSLTTLDHKTPASVRAFRAIFEGLPADAICLSPGGGRAGSTPC